MYEKGLLQITTPPCKETEQNGFVSIGYCECGEVHKVFDSAQDPTGECGANTAYLPHSCDEWVVGSPQEVAALMLDLRDALAKMTNGRTVATVEFEFQSTEFEHA
jgi:hypothetical protein